MHGQDLLTRRDVVTDWQIGLLWNRDVIKPSKLLPRLFDNSVRTWPNVVKLNSSTWACAGEGPEQIHRDIYLVLRVPERILSPIKQ